MYVSVFGCWSRALIASVALTATTVEAEPETAPKGVTPEATSQRAGDDWWSLQPLRDPPIPQVEATARVRNPIDAFVLQGLEAKKLSFSKEADPRTLLRRLYMDLIGLPPEPEEVEAFTHDPSDAAYRNLVLGLLDSVHHGERWARHWLDVARFGESQGFERDRMRPNAWRYRDWVVQALNNDMPYNEFALLQIAGDRLFPGEARGIIPTGFLVAGGWDEVGQTQRSAAMRAVVRADEMEDYVATVSQTFLGLTAHCARCHDHKFDPITQTEYYRISSALNGIRHGEQDITPKEVVEASVQLKREIETQIGKLVTEVLRIDQPVRRQMAREQLTKRSPSAPTVVARGEALITSEASGSAPPPTPLLRWEFFEDVADSTNRLQGELHGNARLGSNGLMINGEDGYVSTQPISVEVKEKTLAAWVTIRDPKKLEGAVISIENPEKNIFDAVVYGWAGTRRWAGVGYQRLATFDGLEEPASDPRRLHVALVYTGDGMITLYRNGKKDGRSFKSKGLQTFKPGESRILFGVRRALANDFFDGVIHRASLYDRALSATEVASAASEFISDEEALIRRLNVSQQARRAALKAQINKLLEINSDPERAAAYCSYTTQPEEPTRVQLRGNPATPGDVVSPGGLACVPDLDPDFGLPPDGPEAQRRIKLAEWITDRRNPLFARVIVNRLWHYHFGRGIVETPNDFGFNGGRPSHPELIDYLAARLIESGWSLKVIHELIVTSSTWRQSSGYRERPASVDADNRLLWRKSRMRLEGEVLRDAILQVSGQLNPQVGGPPYQDFTFREFNSIFYTLIDAIGPEFNRRTLYRMWLRASRPHLLNVFDCPDPSATTPSRAVTTTPAQSLSLMNNSFVLRMSDHFAERVKASVDTGPSTQIHRLFALAYGRPPSADEVEAGQKFAEEHGLPSLCRVVFNSNEFLYAD